MSEDFSNMGNAPVTLDTGNSGDVGVVDNQGYTEPTEVEVPTIDDGSQTQTENTFWNGNPNELPPEVQPIYKNLQADYTKKMQEIAQQQEKIKGYDVFMQNPVAEIKRLANVYGLSIAEATQIVQEQQQKDWNPETWDDVYSRFEQNVLQKVAQQFQPVVQNVQTQTQERILQKLNSIDPNWKSYETKMMDNLQKHPTLVNDIDTLYRISVPAEVLKGQTAKQVVNQINNKAKQAQITGASTTNTSVAETPVNSFDDAVRAAKAMLSKRK